jgi:hypothetical protein
MAEKANQLLHKYHIKTFPIPIDIIENIITSESINIEITKYLKISQKRAVFRIQQF